MNIIKNKKIKTVLAIFILLGLMVPSIRVGAISLACQNSPTCREAAAKEEEGKVYDILKDEMMSAISLSVPLEIDIHSGNTWYEAK